MKKKLYFFLLVFGCISLFGGIVNAQELEVSPGSLSFTANPGSSQTLQLLVRNKGNTEQSFVFNMSDWLTDETGDVKYFNPGTTPRSCTEWITISPTLVTLAPNESAVVNVTVLVPNDNSSTKWAMLFAQSAIEQTGAKAVDKDVQMGMQLSLRIAIPIYQSPASNTFFKGTIDGLVEVIGEDNSRKYESRVINLGDKILNCKVYFTISNLATAEEFTSEPIEFSLLPESNKKIEYKLDKELPKGKYEVAAILDYGYNDELEGIQLPIEVK